MTGRAGTVGSSQWADQMHRYVPCEPSTPLPHHWLSPFAYSFHNYKDMKLWQHAFDIISRNTSFQPDIDNYFGNGVFNN